jgi:Flp pilus assembly pilin Flp
MQPISTRRPTSRALSSTTTVAYSIIASLRDREKGQALVEYTLILVLVALVSVAALTILGGNVASFLSSVASSF